MCFNWIDSLTKQKKLCQNPDSDIASCYYNAAVASMHIGILVVELENEEEIEFIPEE